LKIPSQKILSVILAVHLINFSITITVKDVLKLNAKYVTPFLKFIRVIELKQTISVLIVIALYISTNNVLTSLFSNATIITVNSISTIKRNLISANDYFIPLDLSNLNSVINSENIISLTTNLFTLPHNITQISQISEIPLTLSALF